MAAGLCLTAALPVAAQVSGSFRNGPMHLGVGPQFDAAAIQSRSRPTTTSNCGKWRRVAARLGETYAGARFRQSIVERACAFADLAPVEEAAWSWPWAKTEIDGELPPRLHARYGGWTIRCGSSGRRERCALVHEGVATIAPATGGSETISITTHFVIDQIGGQEQLLWRVFAEKPEPAWFDGSSSPAAKLEVVRIHADPSAVQKRFDACSRFGCLMEADVAVSARMATRLWEGKNILLDVRPAPGITLTQSVPAKEFRIALRELSRLKHAEERVLAGQ